MSKISEKRDIECRDEHLLRSSMARKIENTKEASMVQTLSLHLSEQQVEYLNIEWNDRLKGEPVDSVLDIKFNIVD